MLTDIQLKELQTEFDKISDYKERLNFWDEHSLDFRDDHKTTSDKTIILFIQPQNLNERKLYNKWIIDHWRLYYINEEYKVDEVPENINLLFKDFEALKNEYRDRVKLGEAILAIIEDELKITDQKLTVLAK